MADEHGLDLRLASRKRMDRQSAGARGRLDDAAGQQRDPEAARDTCQYPVDGAEFELAQSGDVALGEDRLESLTVGASGAQNDDLEVSPAHELVERTHGAWRDHHKLLAEHEFFFEVGVTDRPAYESTFETVFENVLDQFTRGARAQDQVDLG